MRRKIPAIGATVVGVASIAMAVSGELEAMLAWWMVIALLLPPLLWVLKTRYVALKTICLLAFTTQFVTLPFFYINRDDFAWGHVKPFDFTAVEAWPMLSKVMIFLVCLIIFFKLLYRLRLIGGSGNPRSGRLHLPSSQSKLKSFFADNAQYLKPSRQTWLYTSLIILVITILVPLNLWMFSQGISIVGVEPPNLPYRLSGILHYLTKYIIPLLLGYLYWKTKRGLFPMTLMLGYACVLGLSSVSRSSLIFVMLPVLAFAWLDRRNWLLAVGGLGTVAGFGVVSLARNFVYIISAGKTGAVTDVGILPVITGILTDPDSPFREADFLLRIFVRICGRIEGFENLVMSQFYDPNSDVGPLGFLLRMIWRPFAPIDQDIHHIQWQGNVLPEGFVNGGALLSNAVILGNANLLWIIASALVAAGTLVLLEKSAHRVIARYGFPDLLGSALVGFLSIIFFIETGGSSVFVLPFLLLIVASWLPPLRRFKRLKPWRRRFSQVPMHLGDIVTSGTPLTPR